MAPLSSASAAHKPPIPIRPGAALSYGVAAPPHSTAAPAPGLPPGRVTLAAAELQAQMAAQQQLGGWQQQQAAASGHPGQADPHAQLSHVQAQCKMLQSQVQQKDRELATLRQRAQQLERTAGGQPGGGGGPQAAVAAQRSAFAVGEMQRQLESYRQQLLFKEQEVGAGFWRGVLGRAQPRWAAVARDSWMVGWS